MRRRGRPGLVGTMARTAVVAGTATAVAGNVRGAQAGRAAEASQQQAAQQAAFDAQAQVADLQAQLNSQQAVASAAAPPAGDDLMAKLTQLNDMKNAGILSEDEFAAAKAKLLA